MNRLTRLILPAAAGMLLMTGALSLPAAVEPVEEAKKLETMAAAARTPGQHAAVAKQFRLRAEALETKAREYTEKAKKSSAIPQPGLAHKWPAMVRTQAQRESGLAMQYTRLAQEARAAAEKHTQLAVEAQFAE
jgi:hypothetical protein